MQSPLIVRFGCLVTSMVLRCLRSDHGVAEELDLVSVRIHWHDISGPPLIILDGARSCCDALRGRRSLGGSIGRGAQGSPPTGAG